MEGKIEIEDLHPKYQMIARIIGLENALKLGKEIGGEAYYLPKLNLEKVRNRLIIEKFTGSNHRELAKKYSMTIRRIYQILEREGKKKIR